MTTVPGAKGKCMPVREDEKFDLEPCLWLHYRLSESVTHIIVSVWSYRRNNESRLRRRKKFIVPRRFSILLNCDVRLKFNHSRINLHLRTQPQNTVHENPYDGLVCIGLSNSLPHWPFARNIYRSRSLHTGVWNVNTINLFRRLMFYSVDSDRCVTMATKQVSPMMTNDVSMSLDLMEVRKEQRRVCALLQRDRDSMLPLSCVSIRHVFYPRLLKHRKFTSKIRRSKQKQRKKCSFFYH